jgi:hypothetical protein
MGVVYVAEQDRPHRTVALKVIKPGLATPSILRRFEHEAEVLGRLHHPGIAQVYEASTAEGPLGPQPFFAMELVDGKPITAFAAEHGLRTRERLDLLARVCDAVQHAHQQSVIHRDLKPSNVLVESSGQPKILDFGVARVSRADGSAATVHTQAGQIIGTLAYMSPEQASGDSATVDTRSDVYSLGVIGYQLLSGKLPLELGDRPIHESLRAVHEEEPTPLSSVDTAFRGDIDTVIAKALHKDKDRRYQSAAEFAADLRRFLANEPILARPPSAWYQLSKFAQRHRLLVVGAAAVVCALTVSLVVALVAASNLRAAAVMETALRLEAERHRSESDAALAFISNVLQSADSTQGGSPEIRLADVLLWADRRADADFAATPAPAVIIHGILGRAFRSLGRFAEAEKNTQASLALLCQHFPERREDAIWAEHELEQLREAEGRIDEALVLLSSIVQKATKEFGAADNRTALLRIRLANVTSVRGGYSQAASMLQALLDERRAASIEPTGVDLQAEYSLGSARQLDGDLEAAEAIFRKVAASQCPPEMRRADPTEAATESLSQMLSHADREEEATLLIQGLLAKRTTELGERDVRTVNTKRRLVQLHQVAGRLKTAATVMREIVKTEAERLGDQHPDVLADRLELCELETAELSPPEALSMVQTLRRELVERAGDQSWVVFKADHLIVTTMERGGARVESLAVLRDLIRRQRERLGASHVETMYSRQLEAVLEAQLGHWEQAETLFRTLVVDLRATLGDSHDVTLMAKGWYGGVLMKRGSDDEAEGWLRQACSGLEARYGKAHPWVQPFGNALAELQGRRGEAGSDASRSPGR